MTMKIDMPYASFNKHFARAREDDNLRPLSGALFAAGVISLLEGAIHSFIKDRRAIFPPALVSL